MENKFGNVLSKLRKEKGLTQKELSTKINISDKAISRWERGSSYPSLDMIYRISKFFGISFHDLLAMRMDADDGDDNLVQEIINEFTEINKRNIKRIKIGIIIMLVITLILIGIVIFTQSYNRFKVYKVGIENDMFSSINGVYVETKIKDTLHLGNIKINNVDINYTDIVSVDLYTYIDDKETVLYNYSSLNDINFTSYQSYVEIDSLKDYFDNLYLKITIIEDDNDIKTYESKITFVEDFSNNKIFYKENQPKFENNELVKLSVNDIIEILKKNDFQEMSNNLLLKETENFSIVYTLSSNRINYTYEKSNLQYRYVYSINDGFLDVAVFNEDNTELEKYTYDSLNNIIIECNSGSCNDYENAMKILERDVLNLLK